MPVAEGKMERSDHQGAQEDGIPSSLEAYQAQQEAQEPTLNQVQVDL